MSMIHPPTCRRCTTAFHRRRGSVAIKPDDKESSGSIDGDIKLIVLKVAQLLRNLELGAIECASRSQPSSPDLPNP